MLLNRWYKAGIKWISDIMDTETGKMLTNKELERKFNITISFTEYLGVQTAIPQSWLNTIQTYREEQEEEEDYKLIDKLLDAEKSTPVVYCLLIKSKFEPPTINAEKWNQDLQTNKHRPRTIYGHARENTHKYHK